jgi:hypothetical protein
VTIPAAVAASTALVAAPPADKVHPLLATGIDSWAIHPSAILDVRFHPDVAAADATARSSRSASKQSCSSPTSATRCETPPDGSRRGGWGRVRGRDLTLGRLENDGSRRVIRFGTVQEPPSG